MAKDSGILGSLIPSIIGVSTKVWVPPTPKQPQKPSGSTKPPPPPKK